MTDAGFFRGTSAEQDNRFTDKQKKLLKQLRFHDVLTKRVDMTKVNLNTIKPWITKRITQFLGMEDEVVVEFVFNQLEADKSSTFTTKDTQTKLPLDQKSSCMYSSGGGGKQSTALT